MNHSSTMRSLRAALLLLAGVFVQPGIASAADTMTLRLQFWNQGPGGPIVSAESAQRDDYAPVSLPLEESEARRSWWLQGFDAKGRLLYQAPVRNQQWRRLEDFDPRTGRIAEVREVEVPRGSFEVAFPYDPRLARVTLRADRASALNGRAKTAPLIELQRQHLDRLLIANSQNVQAASAVAPPPAAATLLDNGNPADRLDVVFVGDGYTAEEMSKWQADALSVANGLIKDRLYNMFRQRINIRRVDVASAESGVDEPDLGIFRDTAMDAAFNCANIERLLCVDTTKVLSIVGAVLEPSARDVIVVVANSKRYGGSGGSVAAISMHSATVELALHELGHTLFGLADEYDYGTCSITSEPAAGNASLIGNRAVKWGGRISNFTAVPTAAGIYPNGTIGVFEGSQYCATGKYRPTEDSKMRTLGQPWHGVNEEIAAGVFARYSRNIIKIPVRMVTPTFRTPGTAADAQRVKSAQNPRVPGRLKPHKIRPLFSKAR